MAVATDGFLLRTRSVVRVVESGKYPSLSEPKKALRQSQNCVCGDVSRLLILGKL